MALDILGAVIGRGCSESSKAKGAHGGEGQDLGQFVYMYTVRLALFYSESISVNTYWMVLERLSGTYPRPLYPGI